MLRIITTLCIIATVALGALDRGIEVRFDGDVARITVAADYGLSQSPFVAVNSGRSTAARPGYALVLWCPRDGSSVCVYTNATGNIIGTQNARDMNHFAYAAFDWNTQGFNDWTIQVNGKPKNYSPVQQYHITPGQFPSNQAARIPSRQSDLVYQNSGSFESSFSNERPPFPITSNTGDFIGEQFVSNQAPSRKPNIIYQNSGTFESGFNRERPPSPITSNAGDFIGGQFASNQGARGPNRKPDLMYQNSGTVESGFNNVRPSSPVTSNAGNFGALFTSDQATRIPIRGPGSIFQGSGGISESGFNRERPQPSISTNGQDTIPPVRNQATLTTTPDPILQDSGILESAFNARPLSSIAREIVGGKTDTACVAKREAYERGLVARFDQDSAGIGRTAYFNLPQSQLEASAVGWVQVLRPEGPEVMASLIMWCPRDDYTVCVFTDDTGYVAGTQTAMDENLFKDAILDWKTQGYTYWTTQVNGVTKNYWTAQQYYITPDLLAMDPATRIAKRNPETLHQDSYILVSGINGELMPITTNACDIISGKTRFTRQACVDKMGVHYAYKISNATACDSDQMLPWLTLIDKNQLVGVTLVMYSKHTTPEEGRHWFEILDNALLKVAIPNGPDCLYGLPDKSGLVTLHTYFIKRPYDIKCPA